MEVQQPQQQLQQQQQQQQQHIPFRTALLAGAVAGTAVDLSLFPLDTLKTRLQSAGGFFASGGFAGIYRGVGSAVVGSAPGAAFFFVTYESTKRLLLTAGGRLSLIPTTRKEDSSDGGGGGGGGGHNDDNNNNNNNNNNNKQDQSHIFAHMLAASLGEVAACAVRVPTEVVKQRAQAGQHGGSSRRALVAILRGGTGTGGVASRSIPAVWRELYRGWTITVFREVPFTVIQFPLWEAMKSWRRRQKQQQAAAAAAAAAQQQLSGADASHGIGTGVSALESALFGSVAGAVAAAATTPLDVLKTRVMLSKERVSVAAVLARILRHEGVVAPLFAGVVPRVTWISIGGAIFLGSYQWVLNTLQMA